jgi:hypothetical protein
VQLTEAVPRPKVEPERGTQLTEATWLVASEKAGSEKVTAAPVGPVASTTIGEGVAEREGLVASLLIVTETLVVPPALVAVHVNPVLVVSEEMEDAPQPI